MLMVLPLLPANLIADGFAVIRARATHGVALMDDLLAYVDQQWLTRVGAVILSVHGRVRRTNNAAEAFNRQLNVRLGDHPGFWDFMGNLNRLFVNFHFSKNI